MINKYPRRLAVNRAAGHSRVTITRPGGGRDLRPVPEIFRRGIGAARQQCGPREPDIEGFPVSVAAGKGNRGITIRLPHLDRLDIGDGADEH
ncbi:hypothetical protein [Amycolatopsis vastitatis]|uniref:hypothetical protein n=1 Tax=Amycolatopsis vastitatis TaxID=1905142 RepID=UPI001177DE81|nr:hypothetical protein [Amycolatopsis vastitatis]